MSEAEYKEQMEVLLRCSVLHVNGLVAPPETLLTSPPRSPPCNHGAQIGHRVKEERLPPLPRRIKVDRFSLRPRRVEEEQRSPSPRQAHGSLTHVIAVKAHGHILPYVGGYSSGGSILSSRSALMRRITPIVSDADGTGATRCAGWSSRTVMSHRYTSQRTRSWPRPGPGLLQDDDRDDQAPSPPP